VVKAAAATDAETGGDAPETTVTSSGIHAPGPGRPATETAGQRYLREQFAYIRERVMARLTYPPLARRQGWGGVVRVEFTIRDDGTIEDLRIATSSGRSLLDRQALRAVQAAAPFPPPPAPASIDLPVHFAIETLPH
jgi:protein TonB